MSALAGIFNRQGQPVQESDLRAMSAALSPLGMSSETFLIRANVGLAHRLSCFTREDEHEKQPLSGRSGYTLVSAGRIDNREELAESLRIPHSLRQSMPDSAYILSALEKWGEGCFSRLVGSFAIAAYNARAETLLLARDPRGGPSLYFRVDGGALLFASAPRALFIGNGKRRSLNLQFVAEYQVIMPSPPQANSWFQGVAGVEPGTLVRIRREDISFTRFWRPDPSREIRYSSDEGYVEAFTELWERVVREQMRGSTDPAILLSGGIDSTAVAATLAPALREAGRNLTSFTEVPHADFSGPVPPGRYTDETPYVQAMARKYENIELNFVTGRRSFVLDGVEEYFRHAESPVGTVFNRAWFEPALVLAARKDKRILFTGQGGNFTISWPGHPLISQLILEGRWFRAWREANAMATCGMSRSPLTALAAGIARHLPESVWSAVFRARYPDHPKYAQDHPWSSYSLINPEFAREQRIEERAREIGYNFRARYRLDTRWEVLGPSNGSGDPARAFESMFGVQFRSPAADPRIVEFCLAIPQDQFLRNGVDRWLIRRAMNSRVPDEILNNRLRGLQSAGKYDQLRLGSDRLKEELSDLALSPLVRHAVDLRRLSDILTQLHDENDMDPGKKSFYGMLAGRGLMSARFLRWAEEAF